MEATVGLLGLGAVPATHCVKQDTYVTFLLEALQLTGTPIAEKVIRIANNCAITSRYFCVDDSNKSRGEWEVLPQDFPNTSPSMEIRNKMYTREAPKLAIQAAEAAVNDWGGNPQTITHVISVSCTGVMAPGPELHLINHFKLPPTTQRIGINLMGCFGAFRALSVAKALAKEDPNNRILVVCTELCSLHFQVAFSFETFVANALFGDGASAAIIGVESNPSNILWEIVNSGSTIVENSADQMTWEAGNTGFFMKLSTKIPDSVQLHSPKFVCHLLKEDALTDEKKKQIEWAIHPGGKAIIEKLEECLGIDQQETWASWETLDKYGNMSSATFLFVLDKMRKRKAKEGVAYTVGLGFGPGLALEGVVLKVGEKRNKFDS
eukprot:TRINITY_DN4052_c0_g1_i2.p4 TRINITY_DN4052_c0_g1~~TRINITY_DN4052_c0_g1_i2.p4  ORF type:complete len:379 (-),score=66.45 TRINITY_DN4052_c0_g1_i2:1283-2419(-)